MSDPEIRVPIQELWQEQRLGREQEVEQGKEGDVILRKVPVKVTWCSALQNNSATVRVIAWRYPNSQSRCKEQTLLPSYYSWMVALHRGRKLLGSQAKTATGSIDKVAQEQAFESVQVQRQLTGREHRGGEGNRDSVWSQGSSSTFQGCNTIHLFSG